MSQPYFQVGGFRPDIQWTPSHEVKELATFLAQDGSPLYPPNRRDSQISTVNRKPDIELILGITKTGTSHLLLTEAQLTSLKMRRSQLWVNRQQGVNGRSFESLSPIQFRTIEDLTRKLEKLRPKKAKHKNRDTSSVNGPFDSNMELLARSAYEHGRVVYRLLNGMLSYSPEIYRLEDTSWSKTIQVYSFVYNAWDSDVRIQAERRRSPIVLDYGYSSAHLPTFEPKKSSTVHIKNLNNRNLCQRRDKLDFSHAASLELTSDEISAHLQSQFNRKPDSATPIILLVFKQQETIACLEYNGVDTSRWRYGIRELITREKPGRPINRGSYGHPSASSQRRSASPNSRHQSSTSFHSRSSYRSSRDYGPPNTFDAGTYAPVYVLDVQDLYRQLTTSPEALGIVGTARRFLNPPPPDGWCAGNEACLIIDIWRKMISGMDIDEQRELEVQINNQSMGAPVKEEYTTDDNELDDDEVDPNEIAHNVPTSSTAKMSREPEEVSDEGDSDDVSD